MRGNRSRDTTPEVLLRRSLWSLGLRYRKHVTALPGHPDLVLARSRVVVFCDGDFWHGRRWHSLRHQLNSRANASYWIAKIASNRERDRRIRRQLRRAGWHVVSLWETDVVRDPSAAARRVARIVASVANPSSIGAEAGLRSARTKYAGTP